MGEIRWDVDVGREPDVADDVTGESEPRRLGAVTLEGPRPVRESEAGARRHDGHIRAVLPKIRNEGDTIRFAEPVEAAGVGQIAVGDDHERHALRRERPHARRNGAREAKPGCPDDAGAMRSGPFSDFFVIADDTARKRASCGENPGRQLSSELGALGRAQHRSEPELG
jgi:hypothetical protein